MLIAAFALFFLAWLNAWSFVIVTTCIGGDAAHGSELRQTLADERDVMEASKYGNDPAPQSWDIGQEYEHEQTFVRKVYGTRVGERFLSAIQLTTAAGVCAMVDLLLAGALPARGFVLLSDLSNRLPATARGEDLLGVYRNMLVTRGIEERGRDHGVENEAVGGDPGAALEW